ncbi:hypothetical protein D3C86_1144610 [compost metagenome]
MVGRQQDGGQHVVEIVGDAACERAHRIHLLRLRHLGFERLLLGHFYGVNDRHLFRGFIILIDHGIDVETEMPALVARMAGIEGRDIALTILGFGQRLFEPRLFVVVKHGFKRHATVDIIAPDNAGEQLEERRVDAQDAAIAVERGNRHRRVVEKAGKAHGGGGFGVLLPLRTHKHNGPALTRRAVLCGDLMHKAGRHALAVDAAHVEIKDFGALGSPLGLDGFDQRHAFAGDDVGNGHRTG